MAGIGAIRLRFEPLGWGLSLMAKVFNSSLEAGIGASRLGLEPQGWDWSLKDGIGASRPQFET